MDYDPENPLPEPNQNKTFRKFFNVQSEFMAIEGYSENVDFIRIRAQAVSLIPELTEPGETSLVPYLAMNYFDRCISRKKIPALEKTEYSNVNLFAICCFTLAGKMINQKFDDVTELLSNHGLDFDSEKIMKMEIHILTTLKWRMRSLTAISFLEYLFGFFKEGDPKPDSVDHEGFTRQDIRNAIIATQEEMKFTRFKPSIIAACSILSVSTKVFDTRFVHQHTEAVLSSPYLDKDEVVLCAEAMGIEIAKPVKFVMRILEKGKRIVEIGEAVESEVAKEIEDVQGKTIVEIEEGTKEIGEAVESEDAEQVYEFEEAVVISVSSGVSKPWSIQGIGASSEREIRELDEGTESEVRALETEKEPNVDATPSEEPLCGGGDCSSCGCISYDALCESLSISYDALCESLSRIDYSYCRIL